MRSQAGYVASSGPAPKARASILGLWIEQIEGSKIWMTMFMDLHTPGCQDVLIGGADG